MKSMAEYSLEKYTEHFSGRNYYFHIEVIETRKTYTVIKFCFGNSDIRIWSSEPKKLYKNDGITVAFPKDYKITYELKESL